MNLKKKEKKFYQTVICYGSILVCYPNLSKFKLIYNQCCYWQVKLLKIIPI